MMKKKTQIFVFLILVIFSFHNAFATVTIGGNVTIGTGTASILISGKSTPIILDTISSSSSGIQTRYTSLDSFHTFQFSSASNPSPSIQLTSLSSTEADFTVLSSVPDLIGTTLGDQLAKVNVDSTQLTFSFANQVNQFNVNAGKAIQEFFVFVSKIGGSGNGGPAVPPPQAPEPIPVPTVISVEPKSYQLPLGIVLSSETFQFSWNSPDDVYLESVQVGNSPIQISFPDTPLLLKGNTLDQSGSKSLVPFSVSIPWNTCKSGLATTCVDSTNYDIPVTFSVLTNGQRSVITTNVHVEPQTNPFPILFTLTVISGLATVGIILLRPFIKHRRKKQKEHKSETKYAKTSKELREKISGKKGKEIQYNIQIIHNEIAKTQAKKPEKESGNKPNKEIENFIDKIEKNSQKRLKKLDKKFR